jgi:hypothetical protein
VLAAVAADPSVTYYTDGNCTELLQRSDLVANPLGLELGECSVLTKGDLVDLSVLLITINSTVVTTSLFSGATCYGPKDIKIAKTGACFSDNGMFSITTM